MKLRILRPVVVTMLVVICSFAGQNVALTVLGSGVIDERQVCWFCDEVLDAPGMCRNCDG